MRRAVVAALALPALLPGVARAQAGLAAAGGSGGGAGLAGAIVVLALLVLGGGFLVISRKRGRTRRVAQLAEVKEQARDDLVALGEDIRALDLDARMPDLEPAVREDYGRAVDAYDRANHVFETALTPEDMAPAARLLEAGRYAMTSAEARLDGRPPPERRPPCFFDPRHGPSSRDVEWAPPGGATRPVPACEADARRVESGRDPQVRELQVGGETVPYWAAGPMYAPFYGGFFGGGEGDV